MVRAFLFKKTFIFDKNNYQNICTFDKFFVSL